MFYIVNLIALITYAYFTELYASKKRKNQIFIVMSWMHFVLITGLRSLTVGTDSRGYVGFYRLIVAGETTNLDTKSPLFTELLRLAGKICGDSDQVYFFVTGIFIISFFWIGFYKARLDFRKCVIIFYLMFFLMSLNAVRTFMAVSLVFAGYYFIKESETKMLKLLGGIMVGMAVFVHNTALIGFPIIAVSCLDYSKKMVRRISVIAAIVLVFALNMLTNVFVRLFPVYSLTIDSTSDRVGASAYVFQIAFLACLVEALYVCKKKIYIRYDIDTNVYFAGVFLLFIELMMFVVGGNNWYIQRFLLYLEVFVIPIFIHTNMMKNKYGQIIRVLFYVVVGFVFIYRIFRNLGDVSPYLFYWQR